MRAEKSAELQMLVPYTGMCRTEALVFLSFLPDVTPVTLGNLLGGVATKRPQKNGF
jgi:hypothetical protein